MRAGRRTRADQRGRAGRPCDCVERRGGRAANVSASSQQKPGAQKPPGVVPISNQQHRTPGNQHRGVGIKPGFCRVRGRSGLRLESQQVRQPLKSRHVDGHGRDQPGGRREIGKGRRAGIQLKGQLEVVTDFARRAIRGSRPVFTRDEITRRSAQVAMIGSHLLRPPPIQTDETELNPENLHLPHGQGGQNKQTDLKSPVHRRNYD